MPKRSPASRSADDINKRFGARLRMLRDNAGRSQTELGNALRVSFQQIQKYENGTTSISLDRLNELATYFATSVGYLVDHLGVHGAADGATGFAESEQSPYDGEQAGAPQVGLLSREALALLTAFDRIRDRKLRRALVTMVEAYGAKGDDGSDNASAG
jgi:transcriptional regulator with XRE-family HTH domain